MKKYFYSKLSVVRICLLASFLFAFHSDAPLSQYTIPIAAWSISSADLDLDGDIDIVTGHNFDWQTNWSGIIVMKNNGHGLYNLDDSLYFYGWQEVVCTQLDLNPYPEIIFKKESTNSEYIGILYNNNYSDSIFLNTNKYDGIEVITTGDIDNNGFRDILFCSNNKQYWGVFYNYGYHNFSSPEYHDVSGFSPAAIACGDLNGDNRDDIVVCGQSTIVYYSFPTGFQQQILETNSFKDKVAIIDFDGDGAKDLITAVGISLVNFTSIIMYRNQGDTSLVVTPEVFFQPSSSDFSVTDYNNDNLPDIAFLTEFPDTSGTGMTDTIGGIKIFYNQGNFLLSEPQFISLNNYDEGWRRFNSADFDGNGYNDFAIIRTKYVPLIGNLELLFNDGNGNFIGTPVGFDNLTNLNDFLSIKCYPNPFQTSLNIEFLLEQSALVELSVNNSQGNLIQCIFNKKMKGGHQKMHYVGFDNSNALNSGVYIVCLKVNGKISHSTKIVKL